MAAVAQPGPGSGERATAEDSPRFYIMSPEDAAVWWSRFVAAGQRMQHNAPELWPLIVELLECAAEPDLMTAEDLHDLVGHAICLAASAPEPAPPPPLTPDEVLTSWRLVERDALDVELERVALLDPGSLAEIHHWASMVVAARTDAAAEVPPRPPAAEQLLSEVELAARDQVIEHP